MRIFGIHLQQTLALVTTPRPTVIVEVDPAGGLVDLAFSESDAEIIASVGAQPGRAVVDAPLTVPNATGSRDVERVLAWCDIPLFPVSTTRLATVHGGHRAATLLDGWPDSVSLTESSPDLALRMMSWLSRTGGVSLDLADYREQWLGHRPPRYRPKGSGRATPAGIVQAANIIGAHLDLAGWRPVERPDDWQAIRDAAAVDALACAWVAHRAHAEQGVRIVGSELRGAMVVPVDVNLAGRLDLTLERMRSDGQVAI